MFKIASLFAVLAVALPSAALAKPGPDPHPLIAAATGVTQDFRSPDGRAVVVQQDLRSPDAQTPIPHDATFSETLSSPDARPSGAFPPNVPTTAPVQSSPDSFNWGYLAAIAACLMLLAGWVGTQRRRRHGLAIES